ncbi:SprT-like family protein [Abditibacterium utsteinense]|uniref:SprT-like family protein n=1 Tax=Abditibacterium utsteinense TaxID=1960156 RepID=A0A2S8SUL5_9BACT|nr:SprT-like domain-containing protein [Abditibacterium utsteinense]PQV64493.1 SprT-like family protein [Abditibacterium utsteinense]
MKQKRCDFKSRGVFACSPHFLRQTARVPFASDAQLDALYAQINERWFDLSLPLCQMKWSRQLTRAAGNIDVKKRIIKLSIPLLVDAFTSVEASFEICGVICDSKERALEEILKHELIHLWLHERGLPSGHTQAFRIKAREIGQPKTRHGIARPLPKSGWIYICPRCNAQIVRRRRFSRLVACARCCKAHSGGVFDARFKLKGRKISAAMD